MRLREKNERRKPARFLSQSQAPILTVTEGKIPILKLKFTIPKHLIVTQEPPNDLSTTEPVSQKTKPKSFIFHRHQVKAIQKFWTTQIREPNKIPCDVCNELSPWQTIREATCIRCRQDTFKKYSRVNGK